MQGRARAGHLVVLVRHGRDLGDHGLDGGQLRLRAVSIVHGELVRGVGHRESSIALRGVEVAVGLVEFRGEQQGPCLLDRNLDPEHHLPHDLGNDLGHAAGKREQGDGRDVNVRVQHVSEDIDDGGHVLHRLKLGCHHVVAPKLLEHVRLREHDLALLEVEPARLVLGDTCRDRQVVQ